MTREEHIENLKAIASDMPSDKCSDWIESLMAGVKALEQEPCEEFVSREQLEREINAQIVVNSISIETGKDILEHLPPVTSHPKMRHCKDCKYFEYDSVAEVHGIPLIVAHEICKRWSDGCKTKEDGYCFLFEPKMQEVQNE